MKKEILNKISLPITKSYFITGFLIESIIVFISLIIFITIEERIKK